MVIGLEHSSWGPTYLFQKTMQTDKQGAKSIVPKFPGDLKSHWTLVW